MISTGINLVMTVIGFSVSTMFIVFVCTRLICARIHLSASRRSFPLASRSDLNAMERGLHGLEPVVVSNFPTKKYSDEFFSTVDDSQCTVCLADYNNEDVLRILPHCGHAFHVTCIDIWLRQHSTCPVCRISLREVSKKRSMHPLFGSALRPHRSLAAFNQHPRPCGIPGHSPNCMLPGHAFSSRTGGGTRMDSIREDCFVADNNEAQAGERTPSLDEEGNRPSGRDKGNKPLESPSTV